MASEGQRIMYRTVRDLFKVRGSSRTPTLHSGPHLGYTNGCGNSAATSWSRRLIVDLQGLVTFTRLFWHCMRPAIKRRLRGNESGQSGSESKAGMQGTVLFGAAAFAWDRERIKDEELDNCVDSAGVKRSKPKTNPPPVPLHDKLTTPPHPDPVAATGLLPVMSPVAPPVLLHDTMTTPPHRDPVAAAGLLPAMSPVAPPKSIVKPSAVERHPHCKWECLITKDTFSLWRKPHNDSGVYWYKMVGSYNDVSPRAFFRTQMDLEYRKKWDTNALELKVVDQDSTTASEIVFWSTKYPFPMKSREYVYVRRAEIREADNSIVVVSRAVEHPDFPENSNYVRVKEYVSQMVITAHSDIDEDGLDYVCVYFDDPNTYIPNACLSFAYRGVPDFMEKLHTAALQRGQARRENQDLPQQKKAFPWHRQTEAQA